MKNITKKEIAEKTLEIIKEGVYLFGNHQIDLKESIQKSIENTFVINPLDWDNLLKSKSNKCYETKIIVNNCSTIEAIYEENEGLKLGVLNFASAKNPGGGFLGGAVAQEESLARSSSLYATLIKDKTMYEFNKKQSSFLYSDYMIYSPDVLFWFDDKGNPLNPPLIADVITSPAPNKGAMIQHNRLEEIKNIETVFKSRIDKVLCIAALKGVECLILGAWGCGVFRNETNMVARLFNEIISEKYSNNFKKIVFAIFDSSEKKLNYKSFTDVFETKN